MANKFRLESVLRWRTWQLERLRTELAKHAAALEQLRKYHRLVSAEVESAISTKSGHGLTTVDSVFRSELVLRFVNRKREEEAAILREIDQEENRFLETQRAVAEASTKKEALIDLERTHGKQLQKDIIEAERLAIEEFYLRRESL